MAGAPARMSGKCFHNKQVIFKSFPKGVVNEDSFEIREGEICVDDLQPGDVLVKTLYLSVDPYMRGRMNPGGTPYASQFEIGQPVEGLGIAEVIVSKDSSFSEGDIVHTTTKWELYTIVSRQSQLFIAMEKIPNDGEIPLSYYLGVLGMPGMTAYFGFFDVGRPKAGETVFVSAAAGAVGQMVGQYAKLSGCHTVGSAGSNEKVEILTRELGYDAAFNYKEESDLTAALKKHCPNGIDIYYENVGGKMLEAVLYNVNHLARIAACGMVSQYNLEQPEGVHNLMIVIGKCVDFKGFLVSLYRDRQKDFMQKVGSLIREKKIKYLEHMTEGLENAARAFIGMLDGENIGKAVVKVA